MSRIPFFIGLLVISHAIMAQDSSTLGDIIVEIDSIQKAYHTPNPIWEGKHPKSFVFQGTESRLEEIELLKTSLAKLKAVDRDSLSVQDQISREIKMRQLDNEISEVTFKMYFIPFNSEGGFFNQPTFFLPNLPFDRVSDYEDYFRWLPSFAQYMDYNRGLLETGMKEGITAPKVIVENILGLLRPWTSDDLTNNPFYVPVRELPGSLSPEEKDRITQRAQKIIREELLPAYRHLYSFLETQYLPKAPESVGISNIANGKAYYENRIRHFTTLDMTPEEVFQIGQDEVSRIRSLMEAVIKDLKFEGSFADFITFLRTDSQFYPTTGQELLNRATWLSKRAEGQLPRLFSTLYELPFTVEPVPDAIAPNYTGGRYVSGSLTQGKAGIYWVNTYDLRSRTYYTLPALTLHEAVPGHHLQIAIAAELEEMPDFRKSYYTSAFGEGWGLYAEFLGEEMGMYETPYELFGRYTYEMWRACRLVVDVGLHYKGWTRKQAVDFMADNTALSFHEVNTEIDRYIGWPGQAVSYKIGELTIKRLREKAENALEEKFDIRQFHEAILKNGSVPLGVLEEEVDRYIEKRLADF